MIEKLKKVSCNPKNVDVFTGLKKIHSNWSFFADKAYPYDLAFSFSGKQRLLVDKILKEIQKKCKSIRCFYDYNENLLGEDLNTKLYSVYSTESRFCIMLISKEYLSSEWTIHERRAAITRMRKERGGKYILPLKVDDAELSGVTDILGYEKIKSGNIKNAVKKIVGAISGECPMNCANPRC